MTHTSTTAPDRDALFHVAETQAGHFTVVQTAPLGFSIALILHHFQSGNLQRPGDLW